MKWFDPPKIRFRFGQHVKVTWYEQECGTTFATITGINFDHGYGDEPLYTITEADGSQTDMIDDIMMEPVTLNDVNEIEYQGSCLGTGTNWDYPRKESFKRRIM